MKYNQNRINYHNKDTRIKIGLHNHGNMLLKHLNIDEEIEEIEEKDMTTLEGKNLKLDFRAKLKSGKRLDVEGESGVVQNKTLEKTLGYSRELNCQTNEEVISVIIALAEGNNKDVYDGEYCFSFKPFLLEVKKCDGEKILNRYKDKVQNNEEITSEDCGIIDLIPEMRFNRNLSEVIEELCHIIKYGIIPEENRRELTTIMNLNIDYYVVEKRKRDELTEMLKMEEAFLPEYNKMIRKSKKEGIKEGIEKGEKNGKLENIQNIFDEISKNPNMTINDLCNYLKQEQNKLEGK